MNGHPADPTPAPSPAPVSEPFLSPRYKWYLVAMLWWISFFNYADRQAIFSVFPLLQQELGLDKAQQGLLGSSFAWVYGLSAPFAGAMVDRVRRKSAILGGLYVWSLICMATAWSRNLAHLLFFRAAEGLGETFYYPASVSIISAYHGKRTRSRALGFHQTSVYVGTIGGGFFAGLIGQRYGWRWSFIVFGGLGILLGIVLSRLIIEPARAGLGEEEFGPGLGPRDPMPLGNVVGLIMKTPALGALMLAFLCANFVALVLLAWMPSFLHEKFELDLAWSGLTATLFVQVASMVGSPIGGWLADELRQRTPAGRAAVQAIGVVGGAPFVFLCGQSESVSGLILILSAWGFFKGLYDANIFASAFDVVPPEARGTVAGVMNLVGWLGGGSAPLIIGRLAMHYGLSAAISSAAVVYIAAGVLLLAACWFLIRPMTEGAPPHVPGG
jgi:MFS family permease